MFLSVSFEAVKRLFAFAYDGTDDNKAGLKNNKKCFLPREKIENYNVLIDGKNFYYQQINDLINSMKKSEKYQKDKMMIILQDIYKIMHILKTITD